MVVEAILDFFFAISSGLLELLPEVSWNVNTSAWEYAKDILDMVAYFLPIGTITAIIALIWMLVEFRIVVALLRTLKGLIPFLN